MAGTSPRKDTAHWTERLMAAGANSARRRHTPVLGLIALSLVAGLFQAGLILWIASQVFMP